MYTPKIFYEVVLNYCIDQCTNPQLRWSCTLNWRISISLRKIIKAYSIVRTYIKNECTHAVYVFLEFQELPTDDIRCMPLVLCLTRTMSPAHGLVLCAWAPDSWQRLACWRTGAGKFLYLGSNKVTLQTKFVPIILASTIIETGIQSVSQCKACAMQSKVAQPESARFSNTKSTFLESLSKGAENSIPLSLGEASRNGSSVLPIEVM